MGTPRGAGEGRGREPAATWGKTLPARSITLFRKMKSFPCINYEDFCIDNNCVRIHLVN